MVDRGTVQKHVEFYSKNKFEKLVHPVGFIIRIKNVGTDVSEGSIASTFSVAAKVQMMCPKRRYLPARPQNDAINHTITV